MTTQVAILEDYPAALALEVPVPAGRQSPWRKIGLCITLMAAINIGSKIGLVVGLPLHLAPWVIVAINPMPMFLASSASHDGLWLYLLVGTLRLSLADPLSYLIGRYGAEAVASGRAKPVADRSWLLRRLAAIQYWAQPVTEHLQRPSAWLRLKLTDHFHQFGYVLLFLRPVNWVLILAGGFRLRPRYVIVIDLAGTLGWLFLIAFLGQHMSHWLLLLFTF